MAKKRLDTLLVEKGLSNTLEEARARILAGEIWFKETRLDKPGSLYPEDTPIELRSRMPKFSSRAGHKLEHGLEVFKVNAEGRVCLDIGASTGGFTHCLLQRGATHVFAVDVGYGLLDVKLKQNPQVTNLEETNARELTLQSLIELNPLAEKISLIVIDVSFISLHKVVEPLSKEFTQCRDFLFLFKPQFEVEPKFVKKGGVVEDAGAIAQALADFDAWMNGIGFSRKFPPSASPLSGKKSGNVEYLVLYERTGSE